MLGIARLHRALAQPGGADHPPVAILFGGFGAVAVCCSGGAGLLP
jgi:hypothetical protein